MREAIPPPTHAGLSPYGAGHPTRSRRDLNLDGVRGVVVAVAVGIILALVVASGGRLLWLLVLASAFGLALSLKPDVFIAGALVVVGLSSVLEQYALHLGSATFYPTDIVVVLAFARSLRPADRLPSMRVVGPTLAAATAVWALLMVVAGIRGLNAGESMITIIRYETALLYFPVLYFAMSRLLRERTFSPARLWFLLSVVAVGFVIWMFVMRILNIPFENVSAGGARLGEVTTSQGSVVRRDFGSATAFIIYPTLALTAVAAMAHSSRRMTATALAFVGVVATLVTLIRAEIFGMLLGIAVILILRTRGEARTSRLFTGSELAVGFCAAILTLAYINPQVRDEIVERTLPGIASESTSADQTAEYRMKALRLGTKVAGRHPNGIGFRNEDALVRSEIDPGYLGHSVPAWLLVFMGWPGLIASVVALAALLATSFRVPSEIQWLHPAFVGIILMLVVYSFGAAGLVSQPWVIVLAGMAIALRFSLGRLPS